MKRLLVVLLISSLALLAACRRSAPTTAQAIEDYRAETLDRLRESAEILDELMAAPDEGIPATIMSGAQCVAVVPSLVRGGFVFGARHGRGVATCRTGTGWSAPAFFTVSGGSWGAQIGAEAVDLVMLVMNEEGMRNLLDQNWTLGGSASVSAGPVGRTAEAGTDWTMRAQVLTYSRSRGLFAGLTLEGANIRPDDDSTRAIYKREVEFRPILTGQVQMPAGAEAFVANVRRHVQQAEAAAN
jgi:SH3 domain-containing YSC84-like protein 1